MSVASSQVVPAAQGSPVERAEERQTEFYPDARVYEDYRDVLRRDDVEVVDVATHPAERGKIIEAALA